MVVERCTTEFMTKPHSYLLCELSNREYYYFHSFLMKSMRTHNAWPHKIPTTSEKETVEVMSHLRNTFTTIENMRHSPPRDVVEDVLSKIPNLSRMDIYGLQHIGTLRQIVRSNKDYLINNTTLTPNKAQEVEIFFTSPLGIYM
eukprot:GHVL01031201.1.p1 GENE.GHVL01031201.1~~GHVL01031201.1.p1  ORF type:complete len:144 (-),score=17.22 GHVL01031201.1:63-494(-)